MLIQDMPIVRDVINDARTKILTMTGVNVKVTIEEYPADERQERNKALLFMLDQVAIVFDVKVSLIIGKKRYRRNGLMDARHTLYYVTHVVMGHSSVEIADAYGGKHHATVLNGCKNIRNFLDLGDPVKDKVNAVISKIPPCK